ncbi:MAG: pyruvate kinase [Pseudomonadota bacterium]
MTSEKSPTPTVDSALLDDLCRLHAELLQRADDLRPMAADRTPVSPASQSSIENLCHYLALRSVDRRKLQSRLATCGLSSLGRCEGHVLDSVERVIGLLGRVVEGNEHLSPRVAPVERMAGESLLERNTEALLGPVPSGRRVRIMVTLPSEAADDYGLVRQLVEQGMDVARINAAHDDAAAWRRMVAHVRQAGEEVGRSVTIAADLPGHKIRTGPVRRVPGVLHLKPNRDRYGQVLSPARLRLVLGEQLENGVRNQVGLRGEGGRVPELEPGQWLHFVDARGARREVEIEQVDAGGAWATLTRASYITNEMKWKLAGRHGVLHGHFVGLPPEPERIRLRKGESLWLTRAQEPGQPAVQDADGQPLEPARIACTEARLIDQLEPGRTVWIDDGKFGARVMSVDTAGALLEITHCRPGGARLREDKGMNVPGMALGLPPLAVADEVVLDALGGEVDLFNFSFVETAEQIEALLAALARRGLEETGVVAKIETARAFQNLAAITLGAMGRVPFGLMIARGDLAVEVGPERMVEVQEEILWLAEAAHLPVVWATQVLDTLARKGVVSRPEMTDAAMGERAECVMLNKGPFIEKALMSLDDVLCRMEEHQHKKTPWLRALHWGSG